MAVFNLKYIHDRRNFLKNNNGAAPVELAVYFSRDERMYINTGIKVDKDQWSKKQQRVTTHKRADSYNYILRQKIKNIFEWEISQLKKQKPVTFDSFKQFLKNQDVKYSFNEYFKQQLELDKPKLAPGTFKGLNTVLNRLNEYGTIYMDEFSSKVVYDYHDNLLLSMTPASTVRHHKTLKKYIRRAINNELMEISPYNDFKMPRESSRMVFLTAKELDILRSYKGIERLEKVRDLFLFQCLTGMSYVDMQALKPEDILEHDGSRYIEKPRQKTNRVPQIIPLFPEALKIIQKYEGSGLCFPKISNQKMNSFLKEIQIIKDIHKPLTSHVGRHTFATLMLEKGMPLETISSIIGHSSIKQTSVYAKMQISKIKNDLSRLKISSL